MGHRKKSNKVLFAARKEQRVKVAQARTKRATAALTPGQKLHEAMHGRKAA